MKIIKHAYSKMSKYNKNNMTKLTNYKLLPYTDYEGRGHKIPVFKKFISENKELLYCGVNHTYDPDDDLFNQLRKQMEDFNPNLIILEGWPIINPGNPKREAYFKSVLTKSYRQIVEEAGEFGFAVKNALEKNIDVFCAEPEFEEQINYLGQKYNTGQIFVNQILKMTVQFYTINDGSSIKEYLINEIEGLKSKLAQNTKWKKFDFSYHNFLLIFKEEFKQGFLDCTNEFIIEINDPIPRTTKSYDWTTNNQVTQDEGSFRDNLILNIISQKSKNYNKILAVYGGSHFYAQEKGLETIYIVDLHGSSKKKEKSLTQNLYANMS